MADREHRPLGERRPIGRAIAFWLALDRGWQAVVLGIGIVAAYQLIG